MVLTSIEQAVQADLILLNGNIWRSFEDGICEALAIWQGKVLATGSNREIRKLQGTDTDVIDLAGRFATPGLNDAHLHLISFGLSLTWLDASPAELPTLDALLSAFEKRAATQPKGTWIRARGYDQTKLDVGRHPLRAELDRVAPDHPVMLTRACGHVSICNTAAFERAGIGVDTPVPEGGVIETADGALTGLVAEKAQNLVRSIIPAPSTDELIDAIERGGTNLLSYGITSVMDAAVGAIAGLDEIRAYNLAKLHSRLPVRTWLLLLGDPGVSMVSQCHEAGLVSGVGDDLLRVGGVKIFLDGSAGGRTAWMKQPYLGGDETCGVRILSDNKLRDLVFDAHLKGYQLACHAIGDAAIEQLITAYEAVLDAHPDPDRRHRIEHCGFSDDAQHRRMKKAGIYPCPQQVFIYDFGDAYNQVLGEERGRSSYPFRTWTRMGFKPATGSDAPVCDPNPFPNLYAMLTRKTGRGTVMDAGETVSIEEALRAYTEYGAYSQKAENEKGKLVPGQLADIAIFSRDLLRATPEEILGDTECLMTIRGGKVVYRREDRPAGQAD